MVRIHRHSGYYKSRSRGGKVSFKRKPIHRHHGVYIPPAWKNVQYYDDRKYVATGVDSKGRIQYVYPKKIVKSNQQKKYNRIARLESKVNEILPKVVEDAKNGDQEAQVVYTIYKTGFRPGTEKDTKADVKAHGASTLLKDHVKVKPQNTVEFNFVGKKGVKVHKEVKDKLLSDIIKQRKDDERLFSTSERDVREYFRKKTAGRFKLKDLRTLRAQEIVKKKIAKKQATKTEISQAVSRELVNTPAVALTSYIAPELVEEK